MSGGRNFAPSIPYRSRLSGGRNFAPSITYRSRLSGGRSARLSIPPHETAACRRSVGCVDVSAPGCRVFGAFTRQRRRARSYATSTLWTATSSTTTSPPSATTVTCWGLRPSTIYYSMTSGAPPWATPIATRATDLSPRSLSGENLRQVQKLTYRIIM